MQVTGADANFQPPSASSPEGFINQRVSRFWPEVGHHEIWKYSQSLGRAHAKALRNLRVWVQSQLSGCLAASGMHA